LKKTIEAMAVEIAKLKQKASKSDNIVLNLKRELEVAKNYNKYFRNREKVLM
jgi:hypothetical protein